MTQYAYYPGPYGMMEIGYEDGAVVQISLVSREKAPSRPAPVSDQAARELEEYFAGRRKQFEFPMAPKGTAFQLSVLRALEQIPYGETRSYGEIARAVGRPKAVRAVGMACKRNPIWIAIPCHRVVGANHALTGYAGGLPMKQALLELEQANR